MNKFIIYEYMKKISREDIERFALSQGITLQNNEIDVIHYYIRNEYAKIFSDPESILKEVKVKVRDITYQKIVELYNKYKDKISQF